MWARVRRRATNVRGERHKLIRVVHRAVKLGEGAHGSTRRFGELDLLGRWIGFAADARGDALSGSTTRISRSLRSDSNPLTVSFVSQGVVNRSSTI